MQHNTQDKNWKLQGTLLVLMLLLFGVVFNRRILFKSHYPPAIAIDNVPGSRRAADPWNIAHADSTLHLVKDGDLVLRSGSDALSGMFIKVNTRDKVYSHAGIVFIENGYPIVYNCIGNAADPHAPIKRDSLTRFISAHDNLGFAVYRFSLNKKQIVQLHDVSIQYFKERRKFDPNFNLETDSLLYCTEYVYKAVIKTTGKKDYFPLTQVNDFSFVAVDNLYSRKDMKLICKIGYKQ